MSTPQTKNPMQMKLEMERHRLHLLSELPKNSVGCEIGVWDGWFSGQIWEIVRPQQLHLIDPWEFQQTPAPVWYSGGLQSIQSQADMDKLYNHVRDICEAPGKKERIAIHRKYSTQAADEFADEYFDWVYIDGNHFYDGVLSDIMLYSRKVKPGGLLIGDDYNWDYEPAVKMPVHAALTEFMKTENHRVAGIEIIRWDPGQAQVVSVHIDAHHPLPTPTEKYKQRFRDQFVVTMKR
jgi:hypothetical protein